MSNYPRAYQKGPDGELYRGVVEHRVLQDDAVTKAVGKWDRETREYVGRTFYVKGDSHFAIFGPYTTVGPAKRSVAGYAVGRQTRDWQSNDPVMEIISVRVEKLAAQEWTDLEDTARYVFVDADELDRLRRAAKELEVHYEKAMGMGPASTGPATTEAQAEAAYVEEWRGEGQG
jgi:hypothetical protein